MLSPLRGLFSRVRYVATRSPKAVTRFAGSPSRADVSTGSRTHPWLHALTPSGFVLTGSILLREIAEPRPLFAHRSVAGHASPIMWTLCLFLVEAVTNDSTQPARSQIKSACPQLVV